MRLNKQYFILVPILITSVLVAFNNRVDTIDFVFFSPLAGCIPIEEQFCDSQSNSDCKVRLISGVDIGVFPLHDQPGCFVRKKDSRVQPIVVVVL